MSASETRRRILDAAQRLIETEGLVRLTTKEIARAAGCAEGTLFKHFKRKEDLCLAMVLENSPKFREAIVQKQAGKGSVKRNLGDIALAAIGFSEKLIPLGVTLLGDAELLQRHRMVMAKSGQGPRDAFELVAAYIEGEQQLGRIDRRAKPLSVAALLFGPCFHWVFVRQAMGRNFLPMKDRDFVVDLVEALMNGLTPSESNLQRK
jgi:AcrR family transcriptional regulator